MTENHVTEVQSLTGDGTRGWNYRFLNGEEIIDVTYTAFPGPWVYRVEGRMVDGRPAITSLALLPRDTDNPRPLTKYDIRRTPIGAILTKVKGTLAEKWERRVQYLASLSRTHIKEGRSWGDDHYRNVAWFCTEAELRGVGPRQVIADHWGVNKSTASRWMKEARRRGYLPAYSTQQQDSKSLYSSWNEANQRVDEQIFHKVLKEKTAQFSNPEDGSLNTPEKVVKEILCGTSEGATRIRASILSNGLSMLASNHQNGYTQELAEKLLRSLSSEAKESTGKSNVTGHSAEPTDNPS